MMINKLLRLLSITGLILALSACADFNWRQSLYDIGDQYACQQHEEKISGPGGAVVACNDPAHPDRSRYQDYKNKRDADDQASTS